MKISKVFMIKKTTILLFLLLSQAQALAYKIIVNKKVGIKSLTKTELREIFRVSSSSWKNGKRISLASFTHDSELGEKFSKTVLGMNSNQTQKFYLQKVFKGELSEPPYEVEDAEEMIDYIYENKGAIGYVPIKTPLKGKVVEIKVW